MGAGLIELSETWDGRNLEFRPDFRRGTDIQERSYVRKYIANTSTVKTAREVFDAALTWAGNAEPTYDANMSLDPLPAVWSIYPGDPLARLTHHGISQNKDAPEWWEITCNYATVPDPVSEVATLDWGDGAVELVLEGARAYINPSGVESLPTATPYPGLAGADLYPITNSAGDPFDPPPTDPEHYRVLTVTKNFATRSCTGTGTGTGYSVTGTGTGASGLLDPVSGWEPSIVDEFYARRINSVTFYVPGVCDGYPPGTVFLAEMPKARQDFKNNVEYWITTWVFWIRRRGWNLRIADLGYRSNAVPGLPGFISGEQPVPIYRGGQPAQNPAKLDGNGDEAAINAEAVFLNYRIRERANFNDLNLFQGMF